MEALLAAGGFSCVTAQSGNKALGLLLNSDFAIVLLDVQMPEMDGYEVAELMRGREKTRRVPIIFVTAISKEQRYVFKGYESGAVDYLFKPIDPAILNAKVSVFCELHRQKELIRRQVRDIEEKNRALEAQLGEIRTLRGMLPICSCCKKVRSDDGYWKSIEIYLRDNTHAEFSHSLCPDCLKSAFDEL
jgi:DNA-binding response OmpR family regulator